jgi:hypothetical protein
MAKSDISLVIKGPLKSAKRAAARRGITVKHCRVEGTHVGCLTSCSAASKVHAWLDEWKPTHYKRDRGAAPGALIAAGAGQGCKVKGHPSLGRRRKGRR